jgi:pyruvate-formate lyase-activating enzyme
MTRDLTVKSDHGQLGAGRARSSRRSAMLLLGYGSKTMSVPGPLHWVELVIGYTCNCRCAVCSSSNVQPSAALSLDQMAAALRSSRSRGASGAWFGGGEPTLHPKLLAAVSYAKRLGYARVRVQTNGLRLAYPDFAAALVRAGATEIALSLKGADAAVHDAVTGREGAFELVAAALTNLTKLPVRVEADVLITTRSVPHLARAVEHFASRGVVSFTFWLVSLWGLDAGQGVEWLPSLRAVEPELGRAFEHAEALGVQATSLHTPPCVMPERHRHRYVHAGRYRLLVVTPGQEPFMGEQSPMEGGVYLDGCARCRERENCLGLRADYLRVHGADEFVPIDGAADV